jgi:hypothetical protein
MQGVKMQGATLGGASLANMRVEKGELVAERDGVTLRGTSLTGAKVVGDGRDADGLPVAIQFQITSVIPEVGGYDPTNTGNTYLYGLEQWIDDDDDGIGTWSNACDPDTDGRRVAIPLAATWDDQGDRVAAPGLFTLACTTGVIAKCYRWGYRPWVNGFATNLSDMHWTCTRVARADYCGNGVSNTHDNTPINVWDRLPYPGPIQSHGGLLPPLGMVFEAGWNTGGAVCLSHARWVVEDLLDLQIANQCPERLVPPGLLGATVCDTVNQVLGQAPDATMFNESYLNLL